MQLFVYILKSFHKISILQSFSQKKCDLLINYKMEFQLVPRPNKGSAVLQ